MSRPLDLNADTLDVLASAARRCRLTPEELAENILQSLCESYSDPDSTDYVDFVSGMVYGRRRDAELLSKQIERDNQRLNGRHCPQKVVPIRDFGMRGYRIEKKHQDPRLKAMRAREKKDQAELSKYLQ